MTPVPMRFRAVAAVVALAVGVGTASATAAPRRPPHKTADVSLDVTDAQDPYTTWHHADEGLAYTATVSNAGPSTAAAVVVTFATPGGRPADPPGCTTSSNADTDTWSATCALGDLGSGS